MEEKSGTWSVTTPGWCKIQIDYFNSENNKGYGNGGGGFRLEWQHAKIPEAVVEAPYLATLDPTDKNVCVDPGCGGGNDTPVNNPNLNCEPGRAPVGGVCELCPMGSSCAGGNAAPVPCAADSYQNLLGQSRCNPCPDYSFAYFPGAKGCIACYFGEPKVVAGADDGFWPFALPPEQAREGEAWGWTLQRRRPVLARAQPPPHSPLPP